MRADYPEFYRPTDDELRHIYETGTIALDANVLLSLYEVGPTQRGEVVEVLRRVGDRLFVPYQAGLEFHRNRLNVVRKQARVYADIRAVLRKASDDAGAVARAARLDDEATRAIEKAVGKSVRKALGRIDAAEDAHGLRVEEAMASDPVLDDLDEILEGRIGPRPTDDERDTRIAKGVQRAREEVPPGYLDADKGDDEKVAGDYLLWSELMDHCRTSDRPTLLLTNDTKDDWFAKVGTRTVGPRPELLVEMRAVSEHRYHQQTLGQFLRFAPAHLEALVADSTVEEFEAVAARSAPQALATSQGAMTAAQVLASVPPTNGGAIVALAVGALAAFALTRDRKDLPVDLAALLPPPPEQEDQEGDAGKGMTP